MVLDLSPNKSVHLSSKYQAQQRETEVRKVLDSPHLDFQEADCEVLGESLGTWLQAHFAVCYKFCLYIMQTHTQEANLTVTVHRENTAF